MFRKIVLAAVMLLAGSVACADEIIFTNGERLVGTLQKIEGGKTVFVSDSVGEVTVDSAKVKSIVTDKPSEVTLQDGTVRKGTQILQEEELLILSGPDLEQDERIPLSSLLGINLPPKPPVKWEGSISLGVTSTHGNSSSTDGNLSAELKRRGEKYRIRLTGMYLYGREENPEADTDPDADDHITTEENFTATAKYDYFFTKKTYGYLSGSYKKDHIDDLDYRIITAAGLGYQWIETEILQFNTDAGIALLKEKYTTRVLVESDEDRNAEEDDEEDKPRYEKRVDRKNDLSVQFGCNLGWKPSETTSFQLNATYTPAVDDFSDYFLTMDAELRAAINKTLFSSFKVIMDYDSTPGEGLSSTETKYILGLGINF